MSTGFTASSNCNAAGSKLATCDGLVRVNDTSTFAFNTLRGQTTKMTMPLQPKAIHDEMNATHPGAQGRGHRDWQVRQDHRPRDSTAAAGRRRHHSVTV